MVGDGLANRKGAVAVLLAIIMHLLLLTIPAYQEPKPNTNKPRISITLKDIEETIEPQVDMEPLKTARVLAANQMVENSPPPQTSKPKQQGRPKDEQDQSTIADNSLLFRQFLQAEIARDAQKNPNAAKEFSDTFALDFVVPEPVSDTEYDQGPLGGGQYKVRKNGKIYCVLKVVPLTIDDQAYAFPPTSKDCTPKQKFDPKLRKNIVD
jgi:hypothetical protein